MLGPLLEGRQRSSGMSMTLEDHSGLGQPPVGGGIPLGRSLKVQAIVVMLTAVAVYATTLGHDFVWDDRTILLAHESLGNWSRAAETLTSNFFQEPQEQGSFDYWRPAVVLSHMIETTLVGRRAWGFHLTNVLLHAAASALVFFLGLLWFDRREAVATLGGLLFAVHPVHVETVAWVSGRSDLLLGLFLLLALVGDRKLGLTGKSRWQLLSLAAFAGALLSKEAAAVFPVLVGVRRFLELPATKHLLLRVGLAIRAALPSVVLLGTYLWLRFAIVGVSPNPEGMVAGDRLQLFWTWWSAFWLYTRLLVWPSSLNILHEVVLVESPWSASVVAGLVSFACLLGWAWTQRHRNWGVTYGVLIWLLCLLPTSHFVLPLSSQGQTGFPVAERFLYAPSIGFCLLAGWLLGRRLPQGLARWASSRDGHDGVAAGRGRPVAHWSLLHLVRLGLPLMLLLAAGGQSWSRCLEWRNEVTLFGAAIAEVPANGTAQLNYAAALGNLAEQESDPVVRRGFAERALRHFMRASELVPRNYRVYFGLGNVYRVLGDDERAAASYRESLRMNPALHQAWVNLGTLLAQRGDLQAASESFEAAVRLRPSDAEAKVNLAHVLQMSGRIEEAIRLYEAALEIAPGLQPAQAGLERAKKTLRVNPSGGV